MSWRSGFSGQEKRLEKRKGEDREHGLEIGGWLQPCVWGGKRSIAPTPTAARTW